MVGGADAAEMVSERWQDAIGFPPAVDTVNKCCCAAAPGIQVPPTSMLSQM